MNWNRTNRIDRVIVVAAVACAAFGENVASRGARAGEEECEQREVARVGPFHYYALSTGSMCAEGSFALVGAPLAGLPAGAVFVMEQVDGSWSTTATIVPADVTWQDYFGTSVAMNGSTLVVGVPGALVNGVRAGAVFVYELVKDEWTRSNTLVPDDVTLTKFFGQAVAIEGDVILVGSPGGSSSNGNGPGSAFVFRRNGQDFVLQQRLAAPGVNLTNQFGAAVCVRDQRVFVGAPKHGTVGFSESGAVYVFEFTGAMWSLSQTVLPVQPGAGDLFGSSIAVEGDLAAVGAPVHGPSGIDAGAMYVFARQNSTWQQQQKLTGSSQQPLMKFGSAVDLRTNRIVVGAPKDSVQGSDGLLTQCGTAYVFEPSAGTWAEAARFRPFQPEGVETLASAVAGTDAGFLALSRFGGGSIGQVDSILEYEFPPADCNDDDVPDQCELDCNRNRVADECEIARRESGDCDLDLIPDECQATFSYALDHDVVPTFWGFSNLFSRDYLWLNQFQVKHGGEVITHIATPWSPMVTPDSPITLLLYGDPDQDGDPTDAVLLASVTQQVFAENVELTMPKRFARIAIPPTRVGKPGDSFFVGAMFRASNGAYPAGGDIFPPNAGRSWQFVTDLDTIDLQNPGNSDRPSLHTRNYAIRAISLDCNGNGSWDQCDIDSGFSIDLNANGIPDECDAPCDGDIAGGPPGPGGGKSEFAPDGQVAIDDLLVVINNWDAVGPPGGPGDIAPTGGGGGGGGGDGVVNIDDLLVIINTWGVCP